MIWDSNRPEEKRGHRCTVFQMLVRQLVSNRPSRYNPNSLMPQLTLQQAFDLAQQHHRAGRLNEAEKIYRGILAQQPGHF